MADQDQVEILARGVSVWNAWRSEYPDAKICLSDADLHDADLKDANLSCRHCRADLTRTNLRSANLQNADLGGADLRDADLVKAYLLNADLSDADLRGANLYSAYLFTAYLRRANLSGAILNHVDFTGADLSLADLTAAYLIGADLLGATLSDANLSGADLSGANLQRAKFINTNLSNATLERCNIYGVSAWALTLDGASQKDLRITAFNEPYITVDDLEVAQFIYMMLNNQNLRRVINTITTKTVLILGRFTDESKAVLDALRDELRQQDYVPIMFDFERPTTRDFTETVSTLAHIARFIVADITDPKSIPQELESIIPHLPSVPLQPLRLATTSEYGMFEHFKRYPWVLPTYVYESSEKLIAELKDKIVAPAEAKAHELRN